MVGADESEVFRETLILRKASLTQEQWDKYLSPERAPNQDSDLTVTTALLPAKGHLSKTSSAFELADGPVSSNKKSQFDLETGERVRVKSPRYHHATMVVLPLLSMSWVSVSLQIIWLRNNFHTGHGNLVFARYQAASDWAQEHLHSFN